VSAPDRWEAERQLELRLEGGTVECAGGARAYVKWYERIPRYEVDQSHYAKKLAERDRVLSEMRRIKTRRRAARKPDPGALEDAGTEALLGYESDAKRRPSAARIWYLSEGGELLCTESEPMTRQGAEGVVSRARGAWPFAWAEVVPATPDSLPEVRDVEVPPHVRELLAERVAGPRGTWEENRARERRVRELRKEQPTRCRFVLFPSQRPESGEVPGEPPCGAADTPGS
jgi:hypothetical protein